MKARILVATVIVCLLAIVPFSHISAKPWAYAYEAGDKDSDPTFTISNSPNGNAGVTIDANGYVVATDNHGASIMGDTWDFTAEPAEVAANFTSSAPTIDGQISPSEWDDAGVYDITVPGRGSAVTLYAMHDGGHLYLAMDNPNDTTVHDLDQMGVYFDDNPLPSDGQWTNISCGNPDGEGNFWLLSNDVVEYREWIAGPDTCGVIGPAPGTLGALGYGSGHAQAEIAIDLTSSALRATPGDIINMYMWIYDFNVELYGGRWPSTANFQDPATYGPLKLVPEGEGTKNYLPIVMSSYCSCGPDNYEPNAPCDQAHGPLNFGQTYQSWLSCCDVAFGKDGSHNVGYGYDYFSIQVGTNGTPVTIVLSNIPSGCDYGLYLYRQGNCDIPIESSQHEGNVNETISTSLNSGTYYILIYSGSDTYKRYSTSPYSLRVSSP